MTLKEQIELDLTGLYSTDEFADTVKYYFAGGVPRLIPAIVTYGQGEGYKGSDSYSTEGSIRVKASDVPEPTTEDTISIGSEKWLVIDPVQSSDGLEWIIGISRYSG